MCVISALVSLIVSVVMLVKAHITDSITRIANIGTIFAVSGRWTESSITRNASLLSGGPVVRKGNVVFGNMHKVSYEQGVALFEMGTFN